MIQQRERGTRMNLAKFEESMYKLVVETSTKLPKDVRRAVKAARNKKTQVQEQQ